LNEKKGDPASHPASMTHSDSAPDDLIADLDRALTG